MIKVKDLRNAIAGLADGAPVRLRLNSAPEGLDVDFERAEADRGELVITAWAEIPDEEC